MQAKGKFFTLHFLRLLISHIHSTHSSVTFSPQMLRWQSRHEGVDTPTQLTATGTVLPRQPLPGKLCNQGNRQEEDADRQGVQDSTSHCPRSSTAISFFEAPAKRMVLKENKDVLELFPTILEWENGIRRGSSKALVDCLGKCWNPSHLGNFQLVWTR